MPWSPRSRRAEARRWRSWPTSPTRRPSSEWPPRQASGSGAIVNIGGMSAHTGAKHRAHVLAAKSGLIGFTKALAQDLAESGIRVNCVAPGLIDTVRAPGSKPPQHHQVVKSLSGALGTPEDIAAAVRFLAGPAARYITGQVLHVNGGAYLG